MLRTTPDPRPFVYFVNSLSNCPELVPQNAFCWLYLKVRMNTERRFSVLNRVYRSRVLGPGQGLPTIRSPPRHSLVIRGCQSLVLQRIETRHHRVHCRRVPCRPKTVHFRVISRWSRHRDAHYIHMDTLLFGSAPFIFGPATKGTLIHRDGS
jgi:hypothetical protein